MIIYDIALDSHASGCQQTVRGFYRGEAGEKQLRMTLMEPNEPYPFSQDNAVAVFGKKPDGTCFMHACDIEDGKALYTPTVQTLAVTGSVQCQLVVYDTAGKILFTPEFCIEVAEPVRNETAVESSDDFQYLDTLILKANEQMQFLRDIPALTSGSNGTLLCDGTLVGALVYAADYRELPEAPNGQLAYVLCDWGEQSAGFYLRFLDAWTHLPVPDAHTHKNKALLDALSLSNFHNHDNKALLDSLAESDIHTHENKELLDNIEESLDYLSETAHTHVNKDVLDVLTYADVAHTNRQSLDKLTVTDGELFIDGKRLENVIVWKIQKDPVIPAQPDGTLLYTVYGEDGLMNSDPYLVEIQGVLYRKPAPWKPGQLWVCRGGIWYLLTSEGKTNFDPSKVVQGGGDSIGGIEDDVNNFAPAPNPDEERIYDGDVALLPFSKSFLPVFRDDIQLLHYPLLTNYGFPIGIIGKNTNNTAVRIEIDIYNGKVYVRFVNGDDVFESSNPALKWNYINEGISVDIVFDAITIDGFYAIGAYEDPKSFAEIKDDAELSILYRLMSQVVNTSAEAMGKVDTIDGVVDLSYYHGLTPGRTYYLDTVNDTGFIDNLWVDTTIIDIGDMQFWQDSYTTVYLNLDRDYDIPIYADLLVGGEVPNTNAGLHKWIFNRLPDGQISLGAFDLEAVG